MPFLYIDDLVKGTIQFMETENDLLTDRVYNVQSCAFTVQQVVNEIRKTKPEFRF
jgi:threonine 3-dehydrogenase